MRRAIPFTIAIATIAALGFGRASAQLPSVPFLSNAGVSAAEAIAGDSLDDATPVLVSVMTAGTNPFSPGAPAFDLSNGKSAFWMYMYYSSERAKGAVVTMLQILPGVFTGFAGLVDSTAPDYNDTMRINTALAYANSDMMAQQIRGNAQFQAYTTQRPQTALQLAVLSKAGDIPVEEVPPGYPVNEPSWISIFVDKADSTQSMVCVVSAASGQSMCVDVNAVGSVESPEALRHGFIAVSPNPTAGHAMVTVTAPDNGRALAGTQVGIYDATGRMVLDLSDSFAQHDYQRAEFDAATLPAGGYFCRANGAGWNSVIGVVIVH